MRQLRFDFTGLTTAEDSMLHLEKDLESLKSKSQSSKIKSSKGEAIDELAKIRKELDKLTGTMCDVAGITADTFALIRDSFDEVDHEKARYFEATEIPVDYSSSIGVGHLHRM